MSSLFARTCVTLSADGDSRVALDLQSGCNGYGCPPYPQPQLLDFGSATASVISPAGFAVAEKLQQELEAVAGVESARNQLLERWNARILTRLTAFWQSGAPASEPVAVRTVLAPSGTAALALGARQLLDPRRPARILLLEPEETGRGVPAALTASNPLLHQLEYVPTRNRDSSLRPADQIGGTLESSISRALASGEQIVLVVTDVSKTGLLFPDPAIQDSLIQRFGERLAVLVDACQLRLGPARIRSHLEQGRLVAVSGSKFMGGPSFSGALLLPRRELSCSRDSCLTASAPLGPGVLMRWFAALSEMEPLAKLASTAQYRFMVKFAGAIQTYLETQPRLAPVPCSYLPRTPPSFAPRQNESWDQVPSVFPFLIRDASDRAHKAALPAEQMMALFRELPRRLGTVASDHEQPDQFQGPSGRLGQPVICGWQDEQPLCALRLCLSARQVVTALADAPAQEEETKRAHHLAHQAIALIERAVERADHSSRLRG